MSLSLCIVLISFLILGFMMIVFVSQYSISNKRSNFYTTSVNVAQTISQRLKVYNDEIRYFDNMDKAFIQAAMQAQGETLEAEIFITDNLGRTILCTHSESECEHLMKDVSEDIMEFIRSSGGYEENDKLGGIYEEKHMTVATPIKAVDGATVGAVFVSARSSAFSSLLSSVMEIFILAAIATFALVFCVVSYFTYSMVKPLRQMADVAKSIGDGDFSKRVVIKTEDETGQLGAAINQMADSLAASEGTRRSFIANVSHELKTPMTTIAGFIDGIIDGTIPPENQKKYLKIVSDETKRLSRLVTTMLSLSRIDSGKLVLNKTRFDLAQTIIDTLLTFEQKIETKELEIQGLDKMEATFVDGDPDMIHQVVYNLLENAVKFTPQNGYIKVEMTRQPGMICCSIENSGQGIEPQDLPLVFERFYKTDKSRSQDKNGMGLGLYIVKTIMKTHGGDIVVRSIPNQFCCFEFFLPDTTQVGATKQKLEKKQKIKKIGKTDENAEIPDSDTKDINVEG